MVAGSLLRRLIGLAVLAAIVGAIREVALRRAERRYGNEYTPY